MVFAYDKEIKGTDSELLNNLLWQIDKENAEGWKTIQIYTTSIHEMELICGWFGALGFTVDRIGGCTVLLGW